MKQSVFLILITIFCSIAYPYGEGALELKAEIDDTYYGSYYYALRGGLSDGLDEYDYELDADFLSNLFYHHAYTYSVIPGHLLLDDSRPVDNTDDIFHIKLAFYGAPSTGTSILQCGFHFLETFRPPFQDYNVYLASKDFAFGKIACLNYFKTVDTQGLGFDIVLKNIEIRHYHLEDYAALDLYIMPRVISVCDFNVDGMVNFDDFALLTADWRGPRGCNRADISGPNTLPDGFIDFDDLIEFSNWWLYNGMDYNEDSKVDLVDYAILANNWGGSGIGDYTSPDEFPDGKVDFYDLAVLAKQ